MTPERTEKLRDVLRRRQPDLTIIAEQVHKSRNLAALVRNADAAGIGSIHTVIPKEGYRSHSGTALGSDRWVKRYNHPDFSTAFDAVKAQGMKVYAAHWSDRAIDYREADFTVPCAVLLGAEKNGISEEAAEAADEHIVIPMMGMVSSLNVSTACGIVLTEAIYQRRAAGLYDHCRLSDEVMATTMFEWANRDVANFCRERGLDYPPHTIDGDIVDAPDWYRCVREGSVSMRDWSQEPV